MYQSELISIARRFLLLAGGTHLSVRPQLFGQHGVLSPERQHPLSVTRDDEAIGEHLGDPTFKQPHMTR
jgi:hypothetical protein